MKKALTIMCASLLSLGVVSMVSCNSTSGTGNETADVVAKASKMSLKELEEAAKAEMEASNDTFKVVGLTSTLARGSAKFILGYQLKRHIVIMVIKIINY